MAQEMKEDERAAGSDRFTLNDIHLASVYWPILMELARRNQGRKAQFQLIQYGDLVETAKLAHPADPVVQNAINTSIGRKLDPINWFCRSNDLPNLTCLAVNTNGEPGKTYMRNNNWQAELAEVAAYEWDSCAVQFLAYLTSHRQQRIAKANRQRREMNEQAALDALWEWWKPKRQEYPTITQQQKTEIIQLVRQWLPVEEAVAAVLGVE